MNRCYLCADKTPRSYIKKLGYTINRCGNCGLLFLDFNKDYLRFQKSYYTKGYFTGDKKTRAYANYQNDKLNIVKNSQTVLKIISEYTKSGNLLDVGCAMGFFMEEAEKMGFKPHGVEVSEYAASFAQKKFKRQMYVGSIEELFLNKNKSPLPGNFNVITLNDLIEHLKDPVSVLKKLREKLDKNGILLIQTGDAGSNWTRLMGKNWHFFAPPQHLYFFSRDTLTTLLDKAGFQTVSFIKRGKYVSLRYLLLMTKYMNLGRFSDWLYKLTANSSLGKISIYIKLFDNMVVVARKKV